MKADALRKSLAPAPQGIYPFVELPLHLGYPSLDDFEILSNDQGAPMAAAALREFPRISRICRVSGRLLPGRGRHTRQLARDVHVHDPHFCGLLRHSCDPNVFLDLSELWLWALKDIHKGDWLSMDYAATEDQLQRQFACRCGSYNCRGWITGYDEAPNADGQLFLQQWRRQSRY